jgi:hypothetical protein
MQSHLLKIPTVCNAARLLELSAAIEPLSNARWRTLISCWKAAFPRAGKKPGIPSKSASAPKDVIFNPAGRATNSATMVSPARAIGADFGDRLVQHVSNDR